MKTVRAILGIGLVTAILVSHAGCAFFTIQRVATMAGKEVAKQGYKKIKNDREEKKREQQRKADKDKDKDKEREESGE